MNIREPSWSLTSKKKIKTNPVIAHFKEVIRCISYTAYSDVSMFPYCQYNM